MRNLQQYKGFFTGLLVGLLLVSGGAYASTTGAGTIGSLFNKIGVNYFLQGDNIQDNTVDETELENNSVGNLQINNGDNFTMNNMRVTGGNYYFGNNGQRISGDLSDRFSAYSSDSNISQIRLNDSNDYKGSVVGVGESFGLADGANWILKHTRSSGNVGIGNIIPSQKLDIDGKIRMRYQTTNSDSDDTVATKGYVDSSSSGIQIGMAQMVINGSQTIANVTFPSSYGSHPQVIASISKTSWGNRCRGDGGTHHITISNISNTGFTVTSPHSVGGCSGATVSEISWLALGS